MRNFILGLLALCALLVTGQARADSWIKAESAHFLIYSNAPEQKTRTYVRKLEAFRTLTNMLVGSHGTGPQVKFQIYLLNSGDQMQIVRPSFAKGVGGVYFNCAEGTSAYSAIQYSKSDQDPSLLVLFHEYSHYVMFQTAKIAYPMWYAEGFAEYLSTAAPDKGQISIGEPAQGRMYVLGKDRWIDFARVLKPDFGFAGDRANNPWEIQSFYAQSWLLTHYMMSDAHRAAALNAYFVRVAAGEDPLTAWPAATGMAIQDLHRILARYQTRMSYLKVAVADYPESAIAVSTVPATDSRIILDASLLNTCLSSQQGQAVLARLQFEAPATGATPLYQLALARAQLLFGDPAAAEAPLLAMVSADADNFEARYLLGRVYTALAAKSAGKEAADLNDQAHSLYLAAYRLDAYNAPNLYYLSRTAGDPAQGANRNAVNAANKARLLAPGVLDYAKYAAYTDLAIGNRDGAAEVLTPFLSDPHNQVQAGRIQTAIVAIRDGKPMADVVRLLADVPAE